MYFSIKTQPKQLLMQHRRAVSEHLIVRQGANSEAARKSPRHTERDGATIYEMFDMYEGEQALRKQWAELSDYYLHDLEFGYRSYVHDGV